MSALALGVMTRHVVRPSVEEVAAAVRGLGLTVVQLSLDAPDPALLPERLTEAEARRIAAAFRAAGVRVAAVSGTFNVLDPERARLRVNLDRFAYLCDACGWLETRVVTACSGTRDPQSMWRHHPDNQQPAAWEELVERTGRARRGRRGAGVVVAYEPETANVLDTTEKAQRLLEIIGSPALGITFDPANFFYPADLPRMREVLEEGFRRLGPAHRPGPRQGRGAPAGRRLALPLRPGRPGAAGLRHVPAPAPGERVRQRPDPAQPLGA